MLRIILGILLKLLLRFLIRVLLFGFFLLRLLLIKSGDRITTTAAEIRIFGDVGDHSGRAQRPC